MIKRYSHNQSICRKVFHLTILIASAVLVCFHKDINAFSLNYLSYKVIRDRKSFGTFARLMAKDKKDDIYMMSKYELFSRGYGSSSSDNGSSDLDSPFFAERTDQFQNKDDIISTQSSSDSSPYFAEKTTRVQMEDLRSPDLNQRSQQQQVVGNNQDEDTKAVQAQKSIETRSDDKSFYTPTQDIPTNNKEASDVGEESKKTYSDTQISLLKRARNEDLSKVVDSFQPLVDEMPEVFAVALIKSLKLNLDESLEGIQDIPNKVNRSVQGAKPTMEDTLEKTSKTSKGMQYISNQVKKSVEDTKGDIWNNQKPIKEALDLAGKASLATAKVAFFIGKGVGSLAWKGSRSVYQSTIGPKVEETWNEQMDTLNKSINAATAFIENTPSRVKSAVRKSIELDQPSDSITFSKTQPQSVQQDLASVSSRTTFTDQPESIERSSAPVSSSINFEKKPKSSECSDDSGTVNTITPPTIIQQDAASITNESNSISNESNSANQRPNIEQAPALSSANIKKQPAFVSRKNLGGANNREKIERSKADVDGKSEKPVAKPAAKITAKSPEELRMEIERAQILAKEISDALDVAERAMKLKPDFRLEDPMIGVETLKPMDVIEPEVPLPPPDSIFTETTSMMESRIESLEQKTVKVETKSKRRSRIRTVADNVISLFRPAKSQNDVDAEFKTAKSQDDLDTEFRPAESQDDLDAGLMEVEESLAREIADALQTAEQALMMASTDNKSSDNSIDQAKDIRAP